jgi:hypothetical protein
MRSPCCGLGGLAVLVSCLSLLSGGLAQSTFSSVFNSYVSSNNVRPSSDGLQVQLQLDQLSGKSKVCWVYQRFLEWSFGCKKLRMLSAHD